MSFSYSLTTGGVTFPKQFTSEVSFLILLFMRKPRGDPKQARKSSQIGSVKKLVMVAIRIDKAGNEGHG